MTLSPPQAETADRTALSPLLTGIVARHGYRLVDEDDLDTVAREQPLVMLLVAGDWWRLAESDDLAVIVPELDKAMEGHVAVLVAARNAERAFQRRFRFTSFPALVFLREGEYLGTMEGVRDWADYLVELPEILAREPEAPPPFRMPAGCAAPAGDA
ncbi:HupG protein [Novosphingobium nitrogenifigens DSM 19370]|uniref:HupG protein n=1 Tax=Novosphingobium nitrogenifigens DSM 19370 TaxID=983920 RepID=F1Z424_9SPHN|nr:HupG protein [Novosphingobium nitrogenifigens]EGD60636.1 HupG protein [Novosphingobium nitrogenifigens DSM 19370]